MEISVEMIKKLREATGSGILDVREALQNAEGDFDKAVDYLRQKGLAKAAKRSDRDASEGIVELYSHGDGRVGVMVEVNCETDFVARSDEFREFAHEIALQIAAAAPKWVTAEQIPDDVIEHEKEIARARYKEEGKPDNIIEKILEGMVEKFKTENCLLNQSYIRDEALTIRELLHEKISSIGENIVVRRFERWERGESID
ncbi:MAG TPA: translation elongation factor Ts [Chloroflexi bacterium]|nr:MAG: translation elongation factor Ts [Chloroflexota bacterium]HDD55857.1 translation elongation factor Ts [Chloroflexota bacterium]